MARIGMAYEGAAMLRRLSRSIFVQMALVTVLFLGWGFYTFVVSPILDRPEILDDNPMVLTRGTASEILNDYAFALRNGGEATAPEDDPEFERILAVNPDMRYYVETDNKKIGNIAQARLMTRFGIHDLNRALENIPPDDRPCGSLSRNIEQDDVWSYIEYTFCKDYSYVEYTGLAHPINIHTDGRQGYDNWLSLYSSYFLYPVIMVFGFLAVIILINVALIRRVAKVAQAIDPDGANHEIPEKGIPVEILPLVRSVNHVIARMDEDQRHRRLFLSAAAHEMRTPLTVLRTRLEMIEDTEQRTRLVQDVRRLSSLVNQLLLLMGVREQRLNDDVDLGDVVREVRDLHLPTAIEREVAIRMDLPEGPVICRGNADLLAVAIGNLLENALRFAPKDSDVLITLDEAATITVSDSGPGLPPDRLTDVFEPFVRLKKRRGGHGLGLAIVKAIAELHNGTACVTNRPESGAQFVFRVNADRPGSGD